MFPTEHARESWTALQLLSYLVDIWKHYRRDHPRSNRLTVIIPLIFSHRSARCRLVLAGTWSGQLL